MRSTHPPKLAIDVLTVMLALGAASLLADSQSRQTVEAVRIEIAAERDSYSEGQDPELTVRLVDSRRRPVRAAKDLEILITVTPVSGERTYRRTVLIERGDSEEAGVLQIGRSGMTGPLRVRAMHPELLEGGTVLYVRPKPRQPPSKKRPLLVSLDAAPADLHMRADVAPAAAFSGLIAHGLDVQPGSRCTPPIIISPTRPMKADGMDWAEITIVQPVVEDTSFFLQTTLGTLDPNPVRIGAGDAVGKTKITSDTVGKAIISCVQSVPPMDTDDGESVTVTFKQPVTGFDLRVDPPRMPWVDRAEIVVTLLRDQETPVATDEARWFALHRDSGSGDIQPPKVEIKDGQFHASATFTPFQTGHVRIAATTPDFPRAAVDVEVTSLPYLMFMLPMLGGMCGGFVAWTRRAPEPKAPASRPWWRGGPAGLLLRIGVGLLAGTILHWAFVFDLLPLPRTVVMNQFSWFVLPAIGGWLGTKVFDVVLKPIGIGAATSRG